MFVSPDEAALYSKAVGKMVREQKTGARSSIPNAESKLGEMALEVEDIIGEGQVYFRDRRAS